MLQDACIIADSDWLLKADNSPPAGMTDRHNIKLKEAVKILIRKSLGEQIRSEFPIETLVGYPALMLGAIEKLDFPTMRRHTVVLRTIRRRFCHSNPAKPSINTCLHTALSGARCIKLCTPNTFTEVKRIRFVVNGLTGNPKYWDAAIRVCFAGLPDCLGILQDRFLEEEAALK